MAELEKEQEVQVLGVVQSDRWMPTSRSPRWTKSTENISFFGHPTGGALSDAELGSITWHVAHYIRRGLGRVVQ